MFRPSTSIVALVALLAWAPPAVSAATDAAALDRLAAEVGPGLRIRDHRATGRARFVVLGDGLNLSGASAEERAAAFLRRHGAVFGIVDADSELSAPTHRVDAHGFERVEWLQQHRGIPVFAGTLRAHFDPDGRLRTVNGTFIPGIGIDVEPRLGPAHAATVASDEVARAVLKGPVAALESSAPRLMVFREGLVRRTPGVDRLVWRVEVTGEGVREYVFVDARDGAIVDRITGTHDVLSRTVWEGTSSGPQLWTEGQPLPYDTGNSGNDDQVNTLIETTARVYDLFVNLSGGSYVSWDGQDAPMGVVWKTTTVSCPNATWNGSTTNFCDGVASDDVVAHEWAHAYTERTHGLIYQWQSGALNEAYSDIFGEIVDLTDGSGTDTPGGNRAPGDCSVFGGAPPPALDVTAPASIAGGYGVAGAGFNPSGPISASGTIELVDDGSGQTSDGCETLTGFTPGNVALIDRGNCNFASKVKRAQNAGATAAIVANYEDSTFNMSGSDGSIVIPAVMIASSDGDAIKAELGAGVQANVTLGVANANTVRWLVGEDSFGFGGAIRDMWNPTCFGDAGKVTDPQYFCSSADGGGVHSNSAVPNHAFALLVDGGVYNAKFIVGLGLTKTAHVYWRAMDVYQVPDSDFVDHADALEQSCQDLIGIDLPSLSTGAPSGQVIDAANCLQVVSAAEAVELAADPPCDFQPLLDPGVPALTCGTAQFYDGFDADPSVSWGFSNSGVYAEYVPRDWAWSTSVPEGGSPPSLYALDDINLGNCVPGEDDQSGVMTATTPAVTLGSDPIVAFRHYVATEASFDGGNLQVSVNGGPFQPVDSPAFSFNAYNATLTSAPDNTNPMAGQAAFSGSDGGVVGGSWGRSELSLAGFATSGDSVELRFDFGVDGCNGLDGWYLDDVAVCSSAASAGRAQALVVDRADAGQIRLDWGASCHGVDADFEIYEGAIGSFGSHTPRVCTTGGASTSTLTPDPAASYYLVVPRNAGVEGSYGLASTGAERAVAAGACLPQAIAPSCSGF